MYGCESWTVKKAERWRIDAFELWCWRRLLRVPWTPRRSNQSILKGTSPGCSLEGLMMKLTLQYFGHLMWRVDSLEKTPDAGKDWRREEKGTINILLYHHKLVRFTHILLKFKPLNSFPVYIVLFFAICGHSTCASRPYLNIITVGRNSHLPLTCYTWCTLLLKLITVSPYNCISFFTCISPLTCIQRKEIALYLSLNL